jgi:hypothetical protein
LTIDTTAKSVAKMITNFNDDIKYYFDASYTTTALVTSIGSFTYPSLNETVAAITEDTVTILGAGISTIIAKQAGDEAYNTRSIIASLTVVSISVLRKSGQFSATNSNYVDGEIHGLIAALEDHSTAIEWIVEFDPKLQQTINDNTLPDLGKGQVNTICMMAQRGYSVGASKVCDEYGESTKYQDWFLPSKDELYL